MHLHVSIIHFPQVNPQTTLLCQMLGITDPFAVFCGKSVEENPDEISLDESDSETATQDDETADETADSTADDTADDTAEEELPNQNTTLDVSSCEKFPTFMHSQSSAEESFFNDSNISEHSHIKSSSTPISRSSGDKCSTTISGGIQMTPLCLPKPKSLESDEARKRHSTEDPHPDDASTSQVQSNFLRIGYTNMKSEILQ